ncbi:MAG: hypothetical protein ACLQME_04585, partial [Alphaproteobacteria bacterium]
LIWPSRHDAKIQHLAIPGKLNSHARSSHVYALRLPTRFPEDPKKRSVAAPADPVPTDAEIEAAAERLGPGWLQGAPRPRAAGASLVVQSLARGRSHAVTVELKRPARRLPRSR